MWDKLSPKEREVLCCIVLGQKRDLTCTGLDMSTQSYNNHRRNLMKKLDCQTDVDLALVAIRNRWVIVGETGPAKWVGGNKIIPKWLRPVA